MKVFAAKYRGNYLTGCAVVVAPSIHDAEVKLLEHLDDTGQPQEEPPELTEVNFAQGDVVVLFNGDY